MTAYSRGIAPFYHLFDAVPPATRRDVAYLLARVRPHAHVLDIGAGTGQVAVGLALHGCTVDALEPDAEMHAAMLVNLQSRFAGACPVSPMLAGGKLPLHAGSYDLVCCLAILHLIPVTQHREMFEYAAGMLAPGGRLVVEVPVASPLRVAHPWMGGGSIMIGQVAIGHSTRLRRALGGDAWQTDWRFQLDGPGGYSRRISRSFLWRDHPVAYYVSIATQCGFRVCEKHAGFDGARGRRGRSPRLVLVLARRDKRRYQER